MLSRYGWFVGMLSAALGLAAMGCDGGGDGGEGGEGGGTTTTSSTSAAPVVLPPNSSGQSCANGESSCQDQAAIQEYSDCAVETCDGEYKQCFGDGYLSGAFGGPCQGLMECANQCQDCDQACLQACSDQHYPGACEECILGPIFDCVVDALTSGTCKIPCGPSSSGGVCDDLKACCNSIAEQDKKDECLGFHDQVKLAGDQGCKGPLDTYKASGLCQ